MPVTHQPTSAQASDGLAAMVLAAGAGRRFGGPKQLARVAGRALVVRAVELALGCSPAGVVVVTGAFGAEVAAALAALPVQLAPNPQWARGMAGSIRCGLGALPARANACLILLADQPAIDTADLRRLVDAWAARPGAVAAAHYAGACGAPAIFPAAYWPGLAALQGDRGARALLATLDALTAVPMPAAAFDIDTPQDLAAALRHD